MDISIVITTVNRANNLMKLLESLLLQDFPGASFEVIIVDNASIDGTFSELKKIKSLIVSGLLKEKDFF